MCKAGVCSPAPRRYRPRLVASYRNINVVVLGRFNPTIFQPEWFRRHALLPEAEIAAAMEERRVLVSGEATVVQFDSLSLIVQGERWQLATAQPDWFGDLGAIARSIFDKLPHTPIEVVGLNYTGDFEVAPSRTVEKLMARWVPLEELGTVMGSEPQVAGTVRASWEGYTASVTLEPSRKLKNKGLFINQNYERRELRSADDLIEILDGDWQKFRERAESVVQTILAG